METARERLRLLWPSEVADTLGIPVATLYAWRVRSEGPPALRVGRHLRWDPADLAAWLPSYLRPPLMGQMLSLLWQLSL